MYEQVVIIVIVISCVNCSQTLCTVSTTKENKPKFATPLMAARKFASGHCLPGAGPPKTSELQREPCWPNTVIWRMLPTGAFNDQACVTVQQSVVISVICFLEVGRQVYRAFSKANSLQQHCFNQLTRSVYSAHLVAMKFQTFKPLQILSDYLLADVFCSECEMSPFGWKNICPTSVGNFASQYTVCSSSSLRELSCPQVFLHSCHMEKYIHHSSRSFQFLHTYYEFKVHYKSSLCKTNSERSFCDTCTVAATELHRYTGTLHRFHLTSAQSCGSQQSAAPTSLSAWEKTGTWSCSPLGVSRGHSHQFQLENGKRKEMLTSV